MRRIVTIAVVVFGFQISGANADDIAVTGLQHCRPGSECFRKCGNLAGLDKARMAKCVTEWSARNGALVDAIRDAKKRAGKP
jgi:hypothetical protein